RTPHAAHALPPVQTAPGGRWVWPPGQTASVLAATPQSTAHAPRGHRPPDTGLTADARYVTASLSVWPPSAHSLAAPAPRSDALPRHPPGKARACRPVSPWPRPPEGNSGSRHSPAAEADRADSEFAESENPHSHPAPLGNTSRPRPPSPTAPS